MNGFGNPLSDRALEDQRLLGLIGAASTASHGVYGAPRIFLDMREAGETCSTHRVARIMRVNHLKALHGYRAPRYARGHTSRLTPNTLQRGFTVQRPNTAWVTDITYVRTWEGWLYLAVVMDLYSRRIVGWSTTPTMARALVLDAILMAVRRRKPTHALIHSDQGSQWGSDAWRRFCHAHHLEPSMNRRGNCWDHAVAESFFSSLKKERIKKRIYKTRDIANAEIYDYIEMFYNRTRRHSHLSGVSPEAFEALSKQVYRCPEKAGKSRLLFRLSRVKFHQGGVPGLRANVAGRSGDPARRGGEGKLELTEAPRSKTVAEGIPEGFRPAASARVAPVGTGAVEP